MDIQMLTSFFMWCTVIDGGILILWTLMFVLAPDRAYLIQSRFFPIHRETYNAVMYSFLGLFKIFFLVFNLVPYLAMLLIQ